MAVRSAIGPDDPSVRRKFRLLFLGRFSWRPLSLLAQCQGASFAASHNPPARRALTGTGLFYPLVTYFDFGSGLF